jgi:ribosomal protein L37AE/L43A
MFKIKDRGNCLGYTETECTKCTRQRVELYENGDKICEKCNWNETTQEYENGDC